MAGDELGVCPHCEVGRGFVGSPCPEGLCARKGYRFIPRPWYDSTRDFAARHHRAPDPLLGRLLDKYLLCGLLGEGGMGAVYVALQMPLRREVALKVISGLHLTEASVARFEREARAISALEHPNIVKLYDYGVGELDFPVPYMVLEYVRHGRTLGETLSRMRDEHGKVPAEVVLVVFRQVLHALAAAHKVGIVHRDMKPDNVMIAPVEGQPYLVKVLDFGLAKAVAEVTSGGVEVGPIDGRGVSRTGQIIGTPYYMAPEQAPARGRPHADPRSDLYAVGVMLFEVFTGARAYDGQTPLEVLMKKGDPTYRPLDLPEARDLSPRLRTFLETAMSVDPGGRFASADEMLAGLEVAITDPGMAAKGPPHSGAASDRPRTPTDRDELTMGYDEAAGGAVPPREEAGSPVSRTPGWALSPGTVAGAGGTEPREDAAPAIPPDRPGRRGWVVAGSLTALVGIAVAAWVALTSEETVLPPPTDAGFAAAGVEPQPATEPAIRPDADHREVAPAPEPVRRSFVIETIPAAARVEVDGQFLGNAPVTYEFPATGDRWRDREVVIRASGIGLVVSERTVSLSEAVQQGRVVMRLEPSRRWRTDRRPGRALDHILGPDVEVDRGHAAPERVGPAAPEPPALPPPSRKEPPPKKPAIPML